MEINTWLTIALCLSLGINGVFYWLIREQSDRLLTIAENSEDLIEMISGFGSHLKAVYSLETFYGDETLKALMDHASSLRVILEDQYGDVAALSTPPVEYEYDGEEEDASEENQEEKHVLYAGTRRRDS
jgi:hypothetical protein